MIPNLKNRASYEVALLNMDRKGHTMDYDKLMKNMTEINNDIRTSQN